MYQDDSARMRTRMRTRHPLSAFDKTHSLRLDVPYRIVVLSNLHQRPFTSAREHCFFIVTRYLLVVVNHSTKPLANKRAIMYEYAV